MKSFLWILALILFMFRSLGSAQDTWESVGPFGGWINDLKEDNSGRLLAATSFGGIYRSSDDAESWQQIYNDTLNFDARSIATNSSGHIFVGSEGIGGVGVLRSTDDGTTWEVLNSLQLVNDLLVTSSGEIFACTFDDGLFRSTDNGTTFTLVSSLPASFTTDIETNSSGHLFVGTQFDAVDLYRSTDNGATWQPTDSGIDFDVVDIFVAGSGDLYATDALKVYRSTNNGDSWTNVNAPSSAGYRGVIAASNGNIYASFGAGTGGIYRTTDGGASWTLDSGLPDRGVNKLLASSGGMIFAGGFGQGVYRRGSTTSLSGNDWEQKVNGMTNTFITGIAQDATSGYHYASTRHALVFRSTDLGVTWEQKSSGLVESDWINDIAVNTDGTIFTISASGPPIGGGISRSTDQGNSWTNVHYSAGTAIACNAQGNVFAGYGSYVYRSTDNGNTWTFASIPTVQNIAEFAFDGNTVFVATGTPGGFGSQGVYMSTDNGETWTALNDGLGDLNVTTIFIADSSAGPNKFGASLHWSGNSIAGTASGGDEGGSYVYDSGTSDWEQIGLASERVVASKRLSFIPLAYLAVASLVGTTIYSVDQSRTILFVQYLTKEVASLGYALTSSTGSGQSLYLLPGTSGYGILRGAVSTSVDGTDEHPLSTQLLQNYPNPFNPKTEISFQLAAVSQVTLTIYDLLGREIATLVNEKKAPGGYKVSWNASGFASGVYFYRLRAGEYVATKKLVLLR